MGYPQPAMTLTIITNNSAAIGIANDTIKQQRSCAIDMHYHWVCDHLVQGQFRMKWHPGKENKADFYDMKHHSLAHHQKMQQQYLTHYTIGTNLLQACEVVLSHIREQ
jgi:hypothetical protein